MRRSLDKVIMIMIIDNNNYIIMRHTISAEKNLSALLN